MENDEVTSPKPKNQGRVEWGKKLGKMSKERKLKKDIEKVQEVPEAVQDSSRFPYAIAVPGSILVVGMVLYFVYIKTSKSSKQPNFTSSREEAPKSKFSDF